MSATEVCTIKNESGLSLSAIPLGATVTALQLPDGTDVVLGYKDLEVYRTNEFYLGCSVGRVTNRTAGARFTLNGQTYNLTANAGNNHLHGGVVGFNKAVWSVKERTDTSITYVHVSPDGDQGYPGELKAHARYSLNGSGDVTVEYWAKTNAPTPVNMTNHSYFNLKGKGTTEDHVLTINADQYTPLGEGLITTGEIVTVEGTPLDFHTPCRVGDRMQLAGERGYDHNYCLNTAPVFEGDDKLRWAATLKDNSSARTLEVYTNQPCVQFYAAGYLDNKTLGKDGQPLQPHGGLCLETQIHPNAVNQPKFPNIILKPGDRYYSKTVWRFSW